MFKNLWIERFSSSRINNATLNLLHEIITTQNSSQNVAITAKKKKVTYTNVKQGLVTGRGRLEIAERLTTSAHTQTNPCC